MTADVLLRWLLDGAVVTSAALLLVLALRHPLRRMFGARIAYMAWALVPLALAAVSLPAPRSTTALLQALPLLRPTVIVGAATPLANAASPAASSAINWLPLLALAWCLGAVLLALHFRRQQQRFVAGLGQLRPRGDGTFAAGAELCPAVIGAWRPRIVLPVDFEARYPGPQAALVLAHERAHVRRGDVRANLAMAALRCLHWFNPLLHMAAERFRLDQELACDAAVLARNPQARRAYADAMLNTQLAVPGLPVGCHWQSSQSLKERILMLKRPQPGAWRRRLGAIALCAVLASSSYAAWALRPASDAAPVYRGFVVGQGIAIANVRIPKGMSGELSGPSMASAPDGESTNVMLDPHLDLRIESKAARDPWLVRVKATGTTSHPRVTWSLERNGRVERETTLPVPAGAPMAIDLSMLVDAQGRKPELAFSRLPADRVIDTREHALMRDADDAYREGETLHAFSSNYDADGSAVLMVGIGTDGRVRTVDVERISPPGALTGQELDWLVRNNVYRPRIVDGKRVPTRIRLQVEFAREPPPWPAEPTAPSPGTSRVPGSMASAAQEANNMAVRMNSSPPPKYPAEAVANKVGGKVILIVDVAIDGSVKHAVVEKAEPAGVFDANAIAAVKQWKFAPARENGKPVEGRVRVPIDFELDKEEPEAKRAASAVPGGTAAS